MQSRRVIFDPLTNPLLPDHVIRDDLLKQDLARGIYAQDDGSMLYELWEAMDRPDAERLAPYLTKLADGLEAAGAPSAALLLRAAKANIDQVVSEMILEDPLTRTSNGLAAPFFHSILIDADRLAETVGATRVRVLFDQTSEYEGVFRHAFDKSKQDGFGGYLEEGDRLTSGEVVKLTTGHLEGLSFGNSRREPLIRAADVLSALVKAAVSGAGLRPSAWATVGRLFWGHPDDLPRTCHFIVSNRLKETAFEKAAAAWAPGAILL